MAAIVLAMHVVDTLGVVIDVLWCFAALRSVVLLLEFFRHLVILAISGYMSGVFTAHCVIWRSLASTSSPIISSTSRTASTPAAAPVWVERGICVELSLAGLRMF